MTPNEILTFIKEAIDTFGDIAAKLSDNYMSHINRNIFPILRKIPYYQVDTTHNLSGLISPSAKYTVNYGTAFQSPTRPKPYSPAITSTMSDAERRKDEATYSARKEDYHLYEAAEMEIMRFLATNANET